MRLALILIYPPLYFRDLLGHRDPLVPGGVGQRSRARHLRAALRRLRAGRLRRTVGFSVYRVDHLLANLGWVDFDLGCSMPSSAWADW